MPKAKEAAEKAVALDDGLAEAHTSLGTVKLDYEYDRDGAQREFLRALQINPGSAGCIIGTRIHLKRRASWTTP